MMFKDILLDLMQYKEINQRQLSISAGIPATTISGWINANRLPDYYALIKLSKFFDVPTDYLLGQSNDFNYISIEQENFIKLTPDEESILQDFRALPRAERAQAAEYVHYLANRFTHKQKGDSSS